MSNTEKTDTISQEEEAMSDDSKDDGIGKAPESPPDENSDAEASPEEVSPHKDSEDVEMTEDKQTLPEKPAGINKTEPKKPPETEEVESDVVEEEEPEQVTSDKATLAKKTPKKTPRKKKEEPDESIEDADDEEPKLGLLERPVIIESGKREKRKVDRLELTSTNTPKEKKLEIPEGSGTKLGNCPRIEFQLQKTKGDDLKPLHKLLYGRIGAATMVKRNIRQFCGFDFTTDNIHYDRKLTSISKYTTALLKQICLTLDLERGGTKDAITGRIMEFLMNPEDSGKKVQLQKKRRTSSAGKGDKKRKRNTTEKKKAKPGRKSKKTDTSSEENSKSEEEEEKSEAEKSEAENEEEEVESEEEPPKKKKRKVSPPKKKAAAAKKPVKKNGTKKAEKKISDVEISESSEESEGEEDDKPLGKTKRFPTDDDLKDAVKKILDGADLEEVTMKTVVKQVYAKYPDFDLTEKKDFIKETVKQVIS